MANMFKPSREKTVAGYISAVPAERKADFVFLHDFIRKAAPALKPHFATNMLGYGSFKYLNYKKELIYWPVIGLANQKHHISIYVCAVVDGKYVAEAHKKELGKVKVGKSCISFKRLDELHLPTLKKVIKIAAKNPGLRG